MEISSLVFPYSHSACITLSVCVSVTVLVWLGPVGGEVRFPPLPEATFLGQIAEVPLTPLPVSTETSGKRMLKEERFWVVNSARCLRPKSALALRLADAGSDKMRGKIPSLFPVNSFRLD